MVLLLRSVPGERLRLEASGGFPAVLLPDVESAGQGCARNKGEREGERGSEVGGTEPNRFSDYRTMYRSYMII
jgi:hypothetical protein